MEISMDDFNVLSSEQSRRDVKIAMLKMELQMQESKHNQEMSLLIKERDALWAENSSLREELSLMRTDFENLRFENHWMKQYILLSVERVKDFFSHIRDFNLLSAIKSFVLDMMPRNASAEQIAYARKVMELQMPEDSPQIVIERAADVIAAGGVKNVKALSHD